MTMTRTQFDQAAAASNARLAEKLARAAREREYEAWVNRRRQREQGRQAGLAAAAALTGRTVAETEAGAERARERIRYAREARELFGQ